MDSLLEASTLHMFQDIRQNHQHHWKRLYSDMGCQNVVLLWHHPVLRLPPHWIRRKSVVVCWVAWSNASVYYVVLIQPVDRRQLEIHDTSVTGRVFMGSHWRPDPRLPYTRPRHPRSLRLTCPDAFPHLVSKVLHSHPWTLVLRKTMKLPRLQVVKRQPLFGN